MTSHTPGPWKVKVRNGDPDVIDAEGNTIAWVYSGERAKADAHVIAAAPAILATLEAAVVAHGPFGDDSRPAWWHDANAIVGAARRGAI